MQLSIVIPTYNRRSSLPRALDSILAQTYFLEHAWVINQEFEIILVDDGSSDDTATWVRAHYPAVILLEQTNLGVSAARNQGLMAAQGEWIALLDSDDAWFPGKLSAQFNAIERANLNVCHTDESWIRNGVQVKQPAAYAKVGGMIYPHCLMRCAMSPSSMLLHREVFAQVGMFDETLPACEDYDLWLRVRAVFPVCYVSSPQLYKYGGHADQLSYQYWGMDRFRVIALEKLLDWAGTDPAPISLLTQDLIELTRETLLSKLRILQLGAVKHGNRVLQAEMSRKIVRWQR